MEGGGKYHHERGIPDSGRQTLPVSSYVYILALKLWIRVLHLEYPQKLEIGLMRFCCLTKSMPTLFHCQQALSRCLCGWHSSGLAQLSSASIRKCPPFLVASPPSLVQGPGATTAFGSVLSSTGSHQDNSRMPPAQGHSLQWCPRPVTLLPCLFQTESSLAIGGTQPEAVRVPVCGQWKYQEASHFIESCAVGDKALCSVYIILNSTFTRVQSARRLTH